jgi:hypothetical protein
MEHFEFQTLDTGGELLEDGEEALEHLVQRLHLGLEGGRQCAQLVVGHEAVCCVYLSRGLSILIRRGARALKHAREISTGIPVEEREAPVSLIRGLMTLSAPAPAAAATTPVSRSSFYR